MKYLFLDTNIFIHFKYYDQIPWQEIVKDEYKIVIAPIVLDELDKYKTNTDKKNTKRVKNILSKIEKEYQKDNSLILVNLSTPKDKTYEKFELSKNQPDHALLAAILEFEDQHENDGVILISNDTGARIRARSLDISLVELDEEFLLPKGDSTEEKESKKLRKQLEELKNMLPQVELNFDDGKLFKKVELNPLLQTEKDYLETELILLKKTHSPFIIENQTNDTYTQKPIMLDDLLNSHNGLILYRYYLNHQLREKKSIIKN